MKSIVATIAALFAVTAMANTPAPKAEEKKAAPAAPAASAPVKKAEAKPAAPAPAAAPAKKEEAKK